MSNSSVAGIIYSVTTVIAAAEGAELAQWMQHEHVPAVLTTGCFLGATLAVVRADADPENASINVQYRCRTQADLDRYLAEHAPRLRADTAARYGNRIHALRTMMNVQAEWTV